MKTFYHPQHGLHDPERLHKPNQPTRNVLYSEIARRGDIIFEAMQTADFGPIVVPRDFGMAPIAEVHDHGLISFLQKGFEMYHKVSGGGWRAIPNTFAVRRNPTHMPRSVWGLMGYYAFDTSAPLFEKTWEASYWAAQTAVNAAAATLQESISYALCRPPGHHATADMYGGFCYLNNAAIAANWLVGQGQRVAILDVDYHHGNGTQEIFYGRSDVLFCSIHADPLDEYPNYWGFADEYGSGTGENYNFNFPLPLGSDEAVYLEALEASLAKIKLFVPDVLVISLGVDTFEGDPVGGFVLQTESFAKIGTAIKELGLKTAVIQEGGYQLNHLGQNVVSFFAGLLAE